MDVIFRVITTKEFKGDVFALFPHDVANRFGHVTSYEHVGQHSTADYNHCMKMSKPANESEYKDLKKELENIGYNLNIVKRQNYNKWLESYNNLN